MDRLRFFCAARSARKWGRGMIPAGACILTLLAFAAGCGGEPEAPPPPPVEEELPPPRPIVTQEQFDALLYDTPFADVLDYFGMEPSRQESTYVEGVEGYTRPSLISWYIWENPDGSYIRLGFVNRKLTDMESEKLPRAVEVSSPSD